MTRTLNSDNKNTDLLKAVAKQIREACKDYLGRAPTDEELKKVKERVIELLNGKIPKP